ncbi:hypothetical protein F5Y17DRAFT_328200 [Xylariaceae sp. FL0594]|nr:hypothetical protein F5Y17DRAFT_328200 [Xylariaceae sp. FL0594]
MASKGPERARTPSPTRIPLPGSPTYSYTSTANPLSAYNLPLPPPPRPSHTVLTKADLEQSQLAYSDLLATAKSYRVALASLSTAASAFGCALEACARLKEARADSILGLPSGASGPCAMSNSYSMKATSCTADHLMSASGVHHLIANHQQILSETVYRSFEVPLLHDLDKWRRDIDDAEEAYQKEVALRSREIRRLEKEGMKLHKQRRRDLSKFREHLVQLTSKLDGLSALHGDHAQGLLRESQEASARILDASCSLVRAEVDIFEGLARKGWNGGGLDDLLEKGRDLFAADDEETAAAAAASVMGAASSGEGTKLFSILPPKSILADTVPDAPSSSSARGRPPGRARTDSFLVEGDRYQSLAGAVVTDRGGADTESIFSDFNQSRGVRPFSPQPIRRQPTDVLMDPESLLLLGTGDEEAPRQKQQREQQRQERDELDLVDAAAGEREEEDDDDDDDTYATLRPQRGAAPSFLGDQLSDHEDEAHTNAQVVIEAGAEADEDDVESPWKDEGLRGASPTTPTGNT